MGRGETALGFRLDKAGQTRITTIAAWFVIALSLFWVATPDSERLTLPRSYALIIVASAIIYLTARTFIAYRRDSHPAFNNLFFIVDLVFISLAVTVTGGVSSPFANLFFISVISGALFFGAWGGLLLAAVTGLLLAASSLAAAIIFDSAISGWTLAFYVATFFLVGGIAGFIVQKERTERHQKVMLVALSESLERERSSLRQLLDRTINTQEEERQRIARDLHDGVIPTLAAAKLELQAATKKHDINEKKHASLTKGADLVATAITEIRNLLYELRPAVLEEKGLVRAVELLKEFHIDRGLDVRLKCRGFGGLPAALEIAIFRFIQEAVENACRHSGCRSVRISIEGERESVKVGISDDGCGFNYLEACSHIGENGRGLGLLNMRERAEYLGGIMDVESHMGKGTRIYMHVPFAEPVEAETPPAATRAELL